MCVRACKDSSQRRRNVESYYYRRFFFPCSAYQDKHKNTKPRVCCLRLTMIKFLFGADFLIILPKQLSKYLCNSIWEFVIC